MSDAHRTGGFYRLLEFPRIYDAAQHVLGARTFRRRLVREVVEPQSGARILDIGCGAAAVLLELPDDVSYTGLDLNERYIEAAASRFGDRGTFLCASVADLRRICGRSGELYDIVLVMALLHHLHDEEAVGLLRNSMELLAPGGRIVTFDPCIHPGQSIVARLLVRMDRGICVRECACYEGLVGSALRVSRSLLWTNGLRVPYSHFIMELISSSSA